MSALLQQMRLDSPAALWPLDESSGTTAFDRSGNGRNGTYPGAGVALRGKAAPWGASALFGGAATPTQAITTGQTEMFSTTTLSIEAWVNVSALANTNEVGSIVGKRKYYADLTSDFPIALYYGATEFQGHADSGGDYALDASVKFSHNGFLNRWTHVVFTYEASTALRLYLDGVERAFISVGVPAGISTGGGDWRIGEATEFGGGVDKDALNGSVAYAAIYPSVLPADRVKAHYLAGIRSGVSY